MRNMTSKAMVVMGLAAIAAWAAPAWAGDFALTIDVQGRHGNHFGLTVGKGYITPVIVQPVVPVAPVVVQPVERVWVPPVYRDVIERVWVPTTEIRYRDVPVIDAWGRVIEYRREAYTVQTGYWQEVTRRELVREGYWQIVYPEGSLKRHYGMADNDGCERGEVKIGVRLDKRDHEKDEDRHGVILEKGAPGKGAIRTGPTAEKGADHDNGKLIKAAVIKK